MAIEIERKFKLKSSTVLEGLKGSYFLQAYLAKGLSSCGSELQMTRRG